VHRLWVPCLAGPLDRSGNIKEAGCGERSLGDDLGALFLGKHASITGRVRRGGAEGFHLEPRLFSPPSRENELSRPPVLDEAHLTAEQRVVFDDIRAGPRGLVEGPLRVWLQSPAFAERAQKLGAFCRYGTRLPARLSELAIVIVGAHWRSGFEWSVHAPIAAKAGIEPEVLEAIRVGARPSIVRADECVVYRFSQELLETKRISEGVYKEVAELVGAEGAVELVGVLGYYTLICMTINAFEILTADGKPEPFQFGESAERR
jgi:4-carboxymuconolactone decarboxylase